MLKYLKIQNLAVIDETQLELEKGFVCLTGESGAGKSVLVDAFLLLAGGRASADLVRTGCEKAIVEAEFQLTEIPPDLDLLEDEQLYLRREVSKEGKSRAFVNGALVGNAILAKYAEPAFEIHGQHGQQRLLKERSHLAMFDAQAALQEQAKELQQQLSSFRKEFKTYWELKENESQRAKEADFIRHQLTEINKVKPTVEDDDLDLRLRKARNRDNIRQVASEVYQLVDRNLEPDLRKLKRHLEVLLEYQPELKPYFEQVEGLSATLNDLQNDVAAGARSDDSHDLAQLEARESDLNRLFMKYGRNIEEVLAEKQRLEEQLEALDHSDDQLKHGWERLGKTYHRLKKAAESLNRARKKAGTHFVEKVSASLSELSLPHARFEVAPHLPDWPETLPEDAHLELGLPSLRFLFSANPGEPARALAKVASGGELSRLLLALIEAGQRSSNRLLVFDEIDAGLGGETAHAVGAKLATLGQRHQVLCVTHFAQVARFSDLQIKVEKQVLNGRTKTALVVCDFEERVAELARLMGGDAMAESLRDHARQLITQTQS